MKIGGIRPAAGLEDEPAHARELAERCLEPADELEHTLQRLLVLVRMHLGDERLRGHGLRDARVVLHRAGPEQADAHHPEGLLREMQVVTKNVGLRELGQVRRIRAAHRGRDENGGFADKLA